MQNAICCKAAQSADLVSLWASLAPPSMSSTLECMRALCVRVCAFCNVLKCTSLWEDTVPPKLISQKMISTCLTLRRTLASSEGVKGGPAKEKENFSGISVNTLWNTAICSFDKCQLVFGSMFGRVDAKVKESEKVSEAHPGKTYKIKLLQLVFWVCLWVKNVLLMSADALL